MEYRVGIIGCGGISAAHANGYKAIVNTRIVAAAEPDTQRRAKFGETYGVSRLYEDYPPMLDNEALDIVSICTWPGWHCEMTVAAAKRGVKGILCEKPMAFNLGQADKMIEACEKSGTKLAIGHQHRFDPQSVKAKELVKEGAIGEVLWIFGHCSSDLLSNGTHVVDLIKFFADDSPVTWVMGQIDRHTTGLGRFGHVAEDMAIGHFQFENGIRAFIEQGECAPSGYAFHLHGVEGMMGVNAPQGKRLYVVTKNGALEVPLEGGNSYQREIEELLAWIEGGHEHRSNAKRGRETMEVLMAIMESSRLRKTVRLPLATKESPLELMIQAGQI
ncbi:Gfo/Idh/MocA family oxidoreductase [Candidatus Poribacteria bacterium]|nr:Gfo/Idh/MocA family oxidoreductase [Candidatus Poribacteria bacterium]